MTARVPYVQMRGYKQCASEREGASVQVGILEQSARQVSGFRLVSDGGSF